MTHGTDSDAAGASAATGSDTPGEAFAKAYLADQEKAEARFDFTISDAFLPGKERPRLTARNLFRKRTVETDSARTWYESRPSRVEEGVRMEGDRPLREAHFRFAVDDRAVTPVTGWIQIPDGLERDPESLAAFVDRRLMVRLGTAENRALTDDITSHPEVARLPYRTSYVDGLLAAFDEIEQSGGTAHAMMVNPRDYYGTLVGSGSLLADLARERVMICRHRQVAPGCALVGDFAMAAQLLDAGHSVIRVGQPPPGTFPRPGTAVCAEVYETVAVQLPTHFFHVVPA